jgi:uncharacterized membrane protein
MPMTTMVKVRVHGSIESKPTSAIRLFPFLIIGIAAVVLLLKWDDIPAVWPVHWGPRDIPDRWVTKTTGSVFLPLAMGAALCLFLEAVGAFVESHARKGRNRTLPMDSAVAIALLSRDFLILLEIALATIAGVLGVFLPLGNPSSGFPIAGMALGIIGAAIITGITRLAIGVRRLKQQGFEGLEHYNGIVYRNPDDPRLWVPKISGIGYTINFGHPWAWFLLLLILILPILIAVLSTIL